MDKPRTNIEGAGGSIQDLINRKRFGTMTPETQGGGSSQSRPARNVDEILNEYGHKEPNSPDDEEFLEAYKRKLGAGPQGAKGPQPRSLAELRRITPEELKQRGRGPGAGVPTPHPSRLATPAQASPLQPGDILHLNGDENHVVIFDRDVPSRGYQLVHLLNGDGTLAAQGISLFEAYPFRRIGHLPPEDFDALRQTMAWNRDLIVFHLDHFQESRLVPHPGQTRTAPLAPPPPPQRPATRSAEWPRPENHAPETPPSRPAADPHPLVINGIELHRGQRFQVAFGPSKKWDAVYWGRDEQGTIVAHKTGREWAMMHMDLTRFATTLQAGPMLTGEEKKELVASVRRGLASE